MTSPSFLARGAQVIQAPVRLELPNGSAAMQMGFVVCTAGDFLDDREGAARQIAAALTLADRTDEIEAAARQAERLIADMSRHLPDMALPDYALLNEAPLRLRELIGWTQAARAQIAGAPAGQAA